MDYTKLLEPVVKEIKRAEIKILDEANAELKKAQGECAKFKILDDSLTETIKKNEVVVIALEDKLNKKIAEQADIKTSLSRESSRYAKLSGDLELAVSKAKIECDNLVIDRNVVKASLDKARVQERDYIKKFEYLTGEETKLKNNVQLLNEQRSKLDKDTKLLLKKKTELDDKGLKLSILAEKLKNKKR